MHLTNAGEIADQFQFCKENIGTLLLQWVNKHPDKVFFHWHPFEGDADVWTYSRFWDDVCAVAAGLQKRGIQVEDKVIVHSDNCPEMLIAWYACAVIGAVAVTTNTGATASEMSHYIGTTKPKAAITQPKFVTVLNNFRDSFQWMAVTETNSDGSTTEDALDADFQPFVELFAEKDDVKLADCKAMSPAGIVFTSGTTGLAKAVVHTHGNVMWAGIAGPTNIDLRPEHILLTYLPLFHVNAQLWCTATVLGVGATMVLLPKVTVSRFWPIVQQYGVTHLSMLPLLLNGASPNIPERHTLKQISMAELPQMAKLWRTNFNSIYGSSETVIHALASSPHRSWPEGVLGKTVPGYQVQVMNPETGDMSQPGETGELWVKGTPGVQMFLEYYNDPVATKAAFEGGWFTTGDLVKYGENGHLYFSQRLKDVIKVGGENVGVDEVEAVLLQLPQVREVAVVAKHDPNLDEVPVAYIIPNDNASHEDIESIVLEHCREQLSAFKIPRHVCVVNDFPRSLLNKVAKNKLREMADEL